MKQFITNEVNKMRQVYAITPERIISDFRKEKREMQGYKGRQILELLQNADDASENAEEKHVYIDLSSNSLSISNNGEHFTKEGIKSLMYSDLSPKAKMQNKIGNKGTGFRSVLSWSEEISIKSHELSVGFSERYAVEFLEELMTMNSEVKTYVEMQEEDDLPVATLVVPRWLDSIQTMNNFDTTIVLKLLPAIYEDIIQQLNGIDCETLLFLNNIDQLEIKYKDKTILFKKTITKNGLVEVSQVEDNNALIRRRRWHIKTKTGKFNNKNYDIAVAFTDELDDRKNILYSYFKTDVSFPFPAIIHGTFNLDANRNHLLKSDPENKYLLSRLSDLLIETSIEMTKNKVPSYAPLSLLCLKGELATEVTEMGFEEELLNKIRKSKIFPTINKQYVSFADKPKFYRLPIADVLPKEMFSDLMLSTQNDEIINLLKSLSGGKNLYYEYKSFVEKINKVSGKLKIRPRVIIMKYINSFYHSEMMRKGSMTPNLILDSEGNTVSKSEVVFINPSKKEALETPPAFSSIRFLSHEMYKCLRRELSVDSPRDLAALLNAFGVREYAFDTVAGRIVSRLGKRAKNDSKSVRNDIIKTVKWFYSTYRNLDEKNKDSKLKEFYLLNRQGNIISAKELFMGKEYGNVVCENLLGNIASTRFVADAKILGIENNNNIEFEEFLKWVGVNRYPEIIIKDLANPRKDKYLPYVIDSLRFPINIENCSYNSLKEFKDDYKRCIMNVAQIDLLDTILKSVQTQYILDWFMEDEQVSSIIDKGFELTSKSQIGFIFGYKGNHRSIYGDKIAAYIKWMLFESDWIDTKNGRVSPKRCCLARNSGIDFSPLVEYPALTEYTSEIKERKNKNKKRELYEELLIKTGVASDFGEIDEKTVYSILNALPECDPEGKKAKSFYRQIIQNADINEWEIDARTFDNFIKNGKVFAVVNNKKEYLPVAEVFYLDDKTVCKDVVNSFPLLDLDKRKGKEKVERILGIKPFKKVDFVLSGEPTFHDLGSCQASCRI